MGMDSHMLVACCWIQFQSKAVEHLPVPTPDHTQAGVLCFVAAHRTARKKKKKKLQDKRRLSEEGEGLVRVW
jgi:hypothetical protein